MKYKFTSALALIVFAIVAIPASAHHAVQAVFDQDKKITVKGEITRVEFINPHSYISLNGKTPTGKVQSWTFELAGPGSLKRAGMSRADRGGLKPGDPVTILGFPAKDGTAFGFVQEIHFPDGRVFVLDNRDPYAN
jgi:hypothetical protein